MSRKKHVAVSRIELGKGLSIQRYEIPGDEQEADDQGPESAATAFMLRSLFWQASPCQTALSANCAATDSTIRVAWRDAIESRKTDRKLINADGEEVIIPALDPAERRKLIEASPWPKSGSFGILVSSYIPPSDTADGPRTRQSAAEAMYVTDASRYPWPVRRGLDRTRAVDHGSGALVSMRGDREDKNFRAILEAIRQLPGRERASLMTDLGRRAIEEIRFHVERGRTTPTATVLGENFIQELLEWLTFDFVELHKSSTESMKDGRRIIEVGEPLQSIVRRLGWLATGCGERSQHSPVFIQAMWNAITSKNETGAWSFRPYTHIGQGLRANLKQVGKYRFLDLVSLDQAKPRADDALFYGLTEPEVVQKDRTKCTHCDKEFVTSDQLCLKHHAQRRRVLSLDDRSFVWTEDSILQEREVNDQNAKSNEVCQSSELVELINVSRKLKSKASSVCQCQVEAVENDFTVQSGQEVMVVRLIKRHSGNLALDRSSGKWVCKDCGGLYEAHPKKPKPEPRLFCKNCHRERPAVRGCRVLEEFRWSATNSVMHGRHRITEWCCSICKMPARKSELIQANPKTPLDIERYDAFTQYLFKLKEFDAEAYEIVKNLGGGKDWKYLADRRKPRPYKDAKNYSYLVHFRNPDIFRIRYPGGIARLAQDAPEVHELNIDRFLRDLIRSAHAEECKRRNHDGRVSLRRRMREASELDRAGYVEHSESRRRFAKLGPAPIRKARRDGREFFDHELERKLGGTWRKP